MRSNSDLSQTAATYDRMRTAILSLELLPGEAVSERHLEDFLQSSRTPVRAALTRLEAEGLVRRSGRGYVIAPIDADELLQAYAFRELLECEAVRQAATAATEDDVARLRSLAEATTGSASQPGPELATAFHLEFARVAGNPFLLRALEGTLHIVYRARWLEMSSDTEDFGPRQHAELVELVAARKGEEAADAMARHVRHSRDRLIGALRTNRFGLRGRGLRVVA